MATTVTVSGGFYVLECQLSTWSKVPMKTDSSSIGQEIPRLSWNTKPTTVATNVFINQRDAQILVNSLYFFVKWLYMFRAFISPSSGATFNKLYSAIGTRRYVWLLYTALMVVRNM